jgi:hypothetical protein
MEGFVSIGGEPSRKIYKITTIDRTKFGDRALRQRTESLHAENFIYVCSLVEVVLGEPTKFKNLFVYKSE